MMALGVDQARQQGQERQNRELKASRTKATARNVQDVVSDISRLIAMQQEEDQGWVA